MEISFHRNAIVAGEGEFLQIRLQKIDAVGIVNLAVPEDAVVAALSILSDDHRKTITLMDQAAAPVENRRRDRPRIPSSRAAVRHEVF